MADNIENSFQASLKWEQEMTDQISRGDIPDYASLGDEDLSYIFSAAAGDDLMNAVTHELIRLHGKIYNVFCFRIEDDTLQRKAHADALIVTVDKTEKDVYAIDVTPIDFKFTKKASFYKKKGTIPVSYHPWEYDCEYGIIEVIARVVTDKECTDKIITHVKGLISSDIHDELDIRVLPSLIGIILCKSEDTVGSLQEAFRIVSAETLLAYLRANHNRVLAAQALKAHLKATYTQRSRELPLQRVDFQADIASTGCVVSVRIFDDSRIPDILKPLIRKNKLKYTFSVDDINDVWHSGLLKLPVEDKTTLDENDIYNPDIIDRTHKKSPQDYTIFSQLNWVMLGKTTIPIKSIPPCNR